MEKFSLISTCFNYEKYVGYAIDSFISQTYENKELVIVDDCSTDNSWEIISEYAKKHNNIIAIRNKERQFCSSSNRIALNNATGDFCGVLDGDDVLVSTAMSEVAEKYNKFPHISYIYTQFIWYDGKLEKGRTGISSLPKSGKSLVDMFLMNSHCFSHWRTMRTKCRDKIDIFPEGLKYGVDKHMGFMLEEVGVGGFYNKVLYKYRFHKNNMTHYAIKSQKPDTIILAKKIQKRLDRKVYPIVKNMTPDESVIKLFESSDMTTVRNIVKGKTVLIISRYAGTIDQVYGVIGFYVGKLLGLCGAKVEYIHSRSTIIPNRKYDIGILCHYDTDIILRNSFHLLRAILKNCNHSIFYGNVVPSCIGFNKYFTSRQDYLNPNHEVYTRECYSEDRTDNFEKSVYVGRGCDTVLMHPEQTDFTVIVDASRGPPSIKVSTESFQLADFLNANNYDVHVVGFKKRKLFRQTYERVANKIYNRSYVYVSLISGLYELPVIETQSSGNWVISYKDALHSELLCPSTSFKCNTPESLMETIQKIEKIHDPIIPRRFIMDNGFKWTDVVKRMAIHLAV